ncbi:hypothetical protein Gotri_007534 [Gossypium trilobum]|uniref:DUF4283 domain-containing protein n=1 Tax=Gossypium trilobum TaxID=34281 RepID=A0A7J9EGY9_9ROSI|nr:hypothetical protein [Gossypium trilobum]
MGCGEDHVRRKINRDAMYHVLKSLWFTKEDVIFVVLKEGIILVMFGPIEDRNKILNLTPWLFDQYLFAIVPYVKEVAIEVGRSIGEVATIDWRAIDGGWVDYIRLGVKIDVLKPLRRAVHLVDRDGTKIKRKNWGMSQMAKKDGNGEVNTFTMVKEKDKAKAMEEESASSSPMEKRPTKVIRDSLGKFKCKRKRIRGNNGESNEESPNRQVREKAHR